jgi:sugar lactone lactonase YvrE
MKLAAPLLLAALAIAVTPARAQNVVTLPIGFAQPTGVAVDTHGNIFIADTGNNAVKEIPAGGGDAQAVALAFGTGSNFNAPVGVVVDAAGNLFVTDNGTGSGALKEIAAAGGYTTVTTLQTGVGGVLAIDASGNLFVTAPGAIEEILAAGGYTTTKTIGAGSLSTPFVIAVDAAENVFVLDGTTVKELTAAGAYASATTIITNDGGAGEAMFDPLGIAVDANDNVLLLNENTPATHFSIFTYPTISSVLTYSAASGYATATELAKDQFGNAGGLTRDHSGTIFVTEDGVAEVPAAGGVAATIASNQLHEPAGIAIDSSGDLFLTDFDYTYHAVFKVPPAGSYGALATLTTQAGIVPSAIAVDASGNVFYVDNDTVAEIPAQGGADALRTLATFGDRPAAIAVDAVGDVFITLDNQVQEILAAGGYTEIDTIAAANGNFNAPKALAIDGGGDLFVADNGNNVIKEVLAAGGYQTVQTLPAGSGASAMAVDALGNLYIGDPLDNQVQEISATSGYSKVSTFGGVTAPIWGIAVDRTGNIFVVDGAAKIQEIQAPPTPLAAAILPGSRSVQTGTGATVLATLLNSGSDALSGCAPALPVSAPAGLTFDYSPTDPATNDVSGPPDQPVAIAAGGAQSFVLAFGDAAPLHLSALPIVFDCSGVQPAAVTQGVNTVDLAFSTTPAPDIIALAATITPDLTVHVVNNAGAFALATINAGAAGSIEPEVDTGSATLPVIINFCQTDATGQCITVNDDNVPAGGTATYSVFLSTNGEIPIPFDPANSRIFVRFFGAGGNVYGVTSVAVTTD